MKYINASEILPDMLVEELQQYVQAGYIYIPAKDEQHKSWGELSGYRKELNKRNEAIIDKYQKMCIRDSSQQRALQCLSRSVCRKSTMKTVCITVRMSSAKI